MCSFQHVLFSTHPSPTCLCTNHIYSQLGCVASGQAFENTNFDVAGLPLRTRVFEEIGSANFSFFLIDVGTTVLALIIMKINEMNKT